jgi:TonB family protein
MRTTEEDRTPRFALTGPASAGRQGSLLTSLLIHLAAAGMLATMGPVAVANREVMRRAGAIFLAPSAPEPLPQPSVRAPAVRLPLPPVRAEFHAPLANLRRPVHVSPVEPPPVVIAPTPQPDVAQLPPAPPAPAPVVTTPPGAAFPEATAAPEPQWAVRRVETAGFDRTPKITLPEGPSRPAVAATGFDAAPQAAARANGTHGGVRVGGFESASPATAGNGAHSRVVATSAGFDAAPAAVARSAPAGQVRKTGFDEALVRVEPVPQPARHAVARRPVEIIAKPKPEYTEEGRRNRIEGVVLLEVVFTVSGEVRVLRVVRGLGYGLDEAAIAAARQIRYKPAMEERRPVDERAVLHVVFQMAG